jgi:hypothetical protein
MAEMTEAQRKAFEAMKARVEQRETARAEVPTQRLRTAAQGLTFGTADEIEARARSMATGRPYEDVLNEVRGGLKAYKEARPLESMAYEIGGAAIPALIPGGQSSLLRAGGRAAAEGAAYAFGTGEGGFQERLARVPAGAAVGAGAGAAGYGAAKALGGLTNRLVDSARRTVGGRGSTVVENEIQRLVTQTGKTPDEITQDIIEGRLLAENKTIQAAVRALRAQGGEASTIIQRGMVDRPAQTRAAAMAEMRQYLGDAGAGSQAAARRASEEATVAAERAAYAPFKGVAAPENVSNEVKAALQVVPEAITEVNKMFRGLVTTTPPATGAGPANVTFTRPITIEEAERVRRAISNAASAEYRAGFGGAGETFAQAEEGLRGLLDMNVSELATARAQAAAVRANRNAYKAGQKALAGDVNEKLVDFAKLSQGQNSDEAVAAFRAGLMQALEARATTGSRQSMIRNLANAETKEGRVLREVFPQDQLDDVLKSIDIASEAQEAASKILIGTGSQTTETALEAARQGLGLSAEEVSAVLSGSPVETLNVASKIMKRLVRTELTDAERARIAEILVSTDPQIVRNAIVDESGMQRLADAVNQIMTGAQNVARGAAATQAGAAGGEAMPMQGLLAQ